MSALGFYQPSSVLVTCNQAERWDCGNQADKVLDLCRGNQADKVLDLCIEATRQTKCWIYAVAIRQQSAIFIGWLPGRLCAGLML